MPAIRDIVPRPGEAIDPWVHRKFLPWLRSRDLVQVPDGTLVSTGPDGTRVELIPAADFPERFSVSVGDTEIRIGPGFVGEDMPTIDGVPLDGVMDDGTALPPPALPLDPASVPDGGGFTWVCVFLRLNEENLPASEDTPEGEDWLGAAHVADLDASRREFPRVGFQPLARLLWDKSGALVQVRQLVITDLNYWHVPGTGKDAPGFHHFDGV